MNFDLQPTLENDLIKVVPLKESDFEALFAVASDPLIWEQHPNRDRYKRDVFENFFKGAMESKGAFIVYEKETNKIAGSSRYYELDEEDSSVAIGYTFIAREFWGKGHNKALKTLMLDYAFQFVDKVILHIGAMNFRSQKASEKLGAIKISEIEVAYYGEPVKWNFVYQIDKVNWETIH
ncbi:GNAT family N-acetyltransferase [Pedobacter sp. KBS0701]|uniref:GNAT family N-acetyltransferase n=1 Tax=Pedobacter sp. KBS0701 TaxID=2578106 RepID=UPI00110DBEF2|nr:GNAT family N-acetyltransferase [Pedobacter sp. KBS0701]QDW27856.1 GNAT family N-acetyltransferase [Pedobacter sp. KBS0701]